LFAPVVVGGAVREAGVMSRSGAALRGAASATLAAAVVLPLVVTVDRNALLFEPAMLVRAFAEILHENLPSATPLTITAGYLLAVAAAGALMGVLAKRVRARAPARFVILATAALPALWVVVASTWTVIWLPNMLRQEPRLLPSVPLAAFWFTALALLYAAPVLVVPAVLAALVLEGWTRPEMLPQTGLARPELRRWILLGLVTVATAATTFAALNRSRANPAARATATAPSP